MLDETTLSELKSKLPARYAPPIKKAYRKRFGEDISRWTIMRFFDGLSYTEELHNAILDVVSAQQVLKSKTEGLINA